MKKLLLSSAAICGLALVANPAHAQVELDVGGWFKGYGVFVDQDDDGVLAAANTEERGFDFVRSTEVHFGGETVLDNGLTVGIHFETEADSDDSFDVEESYAYFAGSWGRVNVGAEDGAAYLLQVAVPAADENVDGLRSFVQPANVQYLLNGVTDAQGQVAQTQLSTFGLDYEQNLTGYADKVTYLSPVLSGFQGAFSYTPDISETATFGDALANAGAANDLAGVRQADVAGDLGTAYEFALRYEGSFEGVGVILGGGYSNLDLEETSLLTGADGALTDDVSAWNVGFDLNWGALGFGAAYVETDYGSPVEAANDIAVEVQEEEFVVGLDYTTGPFRFGASYYNSEDVLGVAGLNADRFTGGLVYTYGPGMSLRGVVTHTEFDDIQALSRAGGADLTGDAAGTVDTADATAIMIGTQINF